jgi:hypothetical protein
MNNFVKVLIKHEIKYPIMKPCDAVKLIYQNEFGGGHLIADKSLSLNRIEKEYHAVVQSVDTPLLEDIGNGLARVNLVALDANGLTIEKLNDVFVASSNIIQGTKESFIRKLDVLERLTTEGIFAFDKLFLRTYLDGYLSIGCPPVSHSKKYKHAYQPAYRVIHRDLLLEIEE